MYKAIFIDRLGGVFIREFAGELKGSNKRIAFQLHPLPIGIGDPENNPLEINNEVYKTREFQLASVYYANLGFYQYAVYEEV